MREVILSHAGRYPDMEARDYMKLLYQSEFGPGHLISAQDGKVLEWLEKELAQAQEEGYAPAQPVEDIGGGLCRLHLDPSSLTREDLPLVQTCFALSARPRGSLEGLWHRVGQLAALCWEGEIPLKNEELSLYTALYDSQNCPAVSHSEGFRARYTPHYRVLDRDLALFFPAFRAISAALGATEGPVVVAVDGRCASGKTTFAARCAQVFPDCSVFHMDDFFLPFEKRTPERLAQPGGNVDYERALEEVFAPLSRGEKVELRPFDCSDGSFQPAVTYPFRRLSIVEGSYSHHPALAGYSRVKIFLTCSPETQLDRLAVRESSESLENFKTRWIPMEERYFAALDVQAGSQVVVDTSALKGEAR